MAGEEEGAVAPLVGGGLVGVDEGAIDEDCEGEL